MFYDTIGGVEAKLVTPTGESGGITGVYFKHLGGPKLTMWGEDLAPAQQQVASAIFRSIRSLTGPRPAGRLRPLRRGPRACSRIVQSSVSPPCLFLFGSA